METAGSSAFEQKLQENKPKGPFFIDTGGCECALQEQLNKEAWRCLANTPENIYTGQDGKWFYAFSQSDPDSLTEPPNSNSNPPDIAEPYEIKNGQWWTFPSDGDDGVAGNVQDQFCTGVNQTSASETFYNQTAALLSGQDFPCWQPGSVPLVLQTASEWNTTGCKLGFFCKQTFARVAVLILNLLGLISTQVQIILTQIYRRTARLFPTFKWLV